MRTCLALLLCAPLALAVEVIDGVNPPNPAWFDWVPDPGGGGVATLKANLPVGETIRITGSNVTLDGAGFAVTGTDSGTGIFVYLQSDVTVKGCTVRHFHNGIVVTGGTGNVIEDNEVTDCPANDPTANGDGDAIVSNSSPGIRIAGNVVLRNGQRGIYVHFSAGAVLDGNRVEQTAGSGIAAAYASVHSVVRNTVRSNAGHGIILYGQTGTLVEDNEAHDNALSGVNLTDNSSSTNCIFLGNVATGNQYGISFGGSGHVARGNDAQHNGAGIAAIYAEDCRIEDNDAHFNSSGIKCTGSVSNTRNTVVNNRAHDNTGYGIENASSDSVTRFNEAFRNGTGILCRSGSVAEDNTVRDSVNYGIVVVLTGSTIRNNTITNSGIGVYVGFQADGNLVADNAITSNEEGVRLNGYGGTTIRSNQITGGAFGVRVLTSNDNTIHGNTITGHNAYGIALNGTGNTIYDNLFNNAVNAAGNAAGNAWNVTVAPGPNIVGGPSIGGNFWATPTGTGHSETCTDANGDGFCDDPFVIGTDNVDNLPLVLNTPPSCNPSGAGTYELGSTVTLGGTVADNEGDLVTYTWREGATVLGSGSIQAPVGGAPVALPDLAVSLGLGVHTIELVVDDGHVLDPVVCEVLVEIIDTTDPCLHPVSDCSMLWPPNHQLVTCTIQANASDNDGLPPTLGVSVTSNEPDDGLGDGDTPDDIQSLLVDQATGTITVDLRAERGGVGSGRVYTITITATDSAGNTSMTSLTVVVPRGLGQGGN